jgi:hypothetical protein
MIEIKLITPSKTSATLNFMSMMENDGTLLYTAHDIKVTSENIEKIIQGFEKTLEILKTYANDLGVQNEKN